MEVVDNLIMLVVPGAMEAGLGQLLFWGSLAFSLAVAGAVAVPVNRWLSARGKGHAAVHRTGIHGGLPPRVVGIAAVIDLHLRGGRADRGGAEVDDDAGARHASVVPQDARPPLPEAVNS